jgi:hypothetical protein
MWAAMLCDHDTGAARRNDPAELVENQRDPEQIDRQDRFSGCLLRRKPRGVNRRRDSPGPLGDLGQGRDRAAGGDVNFPGQHPVTVATECVCGGGAACSVDVGQYYHAAGTRRAIDSPMPPDPMTTRTSWSRARAVICLSLCQCG